MVRATAFFLSLGVLASASDARIRLRAGAVEVTGLDDVRLESLREVREFEAWSRILRVSVGSQSSAVLGDYTVDGDVVRFEPMFAFDPGRRYRVTLALDGLRVEEDLALPAEDLTPVTEVSAIYPTAGVLPENQLKLYVHFSQPMAGGDGLRFVRLLDESGDEVIDPFLPLGDAFWDREMKRYTVFFDPGRVKQGILEEMGRPLLKGQRYRLVIDEAWPDARGRPLVRGHEKRFEAGSPDVTVIDPDAWTIEAPRVGTRDPLRIHFHEPLDHGILMHAIDVEGVRGVSTVGEGETSLSFVPHEAWEAGEHRLRVRTVLEDLAGNRIGAPFEVDVFERIERPDQPEELVRLRFVTR